MKILLNYGHNTFHVQASPDEDGILYRLPPEGMALARGVIANARPIPEIYTTFETEGEREDMMNTVPEHVLMALLGIADRRQLRDLHVEVLPGGKEDSSPE